MSALELGVRNALLLQGPMGPFFRHFADELQAQGIQVTKLNFNAGDALYFRGPEARSYRGRLDGLGAYFEQLMREQRIDGVFLFGDGRPVHRKAIEVAQRLGIRVFVFEEGYMRPDWITLEEGGVNGHSSLPRDPAFYRAFSHEEVPEAVRVKSSFGRAGWFSTAYSIALTLGFFAYPYYRHHRPLNAFVEAFRWVRGGLRKQIFVRRERGLTEWLSETRHKQFFLVAMQVHCDYQLVHSPFDSVEQFLEQVMASFAKHAPKTQSLVIKSHPLDRPYREHGPLIRRLSQRFGLEGRVTHVHDLHLPTLLRHASGVVMINSTVGLQAVQAGTPVKVLGHAVYDMAGLTYQGSLEAFWRDPGSVDLELYKGFRAHLMQANQANGSFYRQLSQSPLKAGLIWPPALTDGSAIKS
ncbi:MAG: capsular biosynthesis protein [Myxococcales bacterium]